MQGTSTTLAGYGASPIRITTADPMTHNDVVDPDQTPFIIEASGADALKICFESEHSRAQYRAFNDEVRSGPPVEAYNAIRGNETTGTVN